MREHLEKCRPYINKIKATGPTNNLSRYVVQKSNTNANNTQELNFPTLTAAMKASLDLKCASMCYEQALSFTFVEHPSTATFLNGLNPAYKLPSRKDLARRLLDETYINLKERVQNTIHTMEWLNIVTDESPNITNGRIANISIHTSQGVFHWISEDIGAMQMTAENITAWLRAHLNVITNHDLKRINSIGTDTCVTMLAAWERLGQFDDLKHCFFIPCDSHGIQFLIRDLVLYIPLFKALHDDAQTVVKVFKNANLQYARLRKFQIEIYGTKRSFCLSVITRWSTQFWLVKSMLNVMNA
jgi:Protein of unknown function (DUF 659)